MKVEMISWITFVMGLFLMIVGIVIWTGKKIELVHGEDSAKVPEAFRGAYSRLLGIGVIILSFAVMGYGVVSCFPELPTFIQWIVVGVFGGAGLLVLIVGYKKYYE